MARRRAKVTLPRPELNLTSMMDLVLNLVLFFVMVANFAAASLPMLTPPEPTKSLAAPNEVEDKVIVNLVPSPLDPTQISEVVVGGEKFPVGEPSGVTEAVQREMAISPGVQIHLRADQRLLFTEVQPYMLAIAAAGVQDVHYVAVTDRE